MAKRKASAYLYEDQPSDYLYEDRPSDYLYKDQAAFSRMHGASQHAPIDLTDDAENMPPPGEPPRKRSTKLPPQPTICTCKDPPAVEDLVECTGPSCLVRLYHRACVGLANKVKYPEYKTSQWRCRTCRVASSAQLPTPPEPPSAPPVIPIVAPAVGPLGQQEPNLHPEQLEVVQCIESGQNTFYTGSAGTGKSTVAKAFNLALRAQGKQVDNVAPSGIAALAIGGSTIFSYAGWHPNSFKLEWEKLLKGGEKKSIKKRLCQTDVLVIDEISMVENFMFTRLDQLMRYVRDGYHPSRGDPMPKSPHSARLPFGGAQIVVTGDFCQLPPVRPFQYCLQCGGDETEGYARQAIVVKCKICKKEFLDEDKWAFRSPTWEAANFTCFHLKQIHRQSDVQFINILQKCRTGTPLQEVEKSLLLQPKGDMSTAVKLLPQKYEVLRRNQDGLSKLRGPAKNYECLDFFDFRNPNEPDLAKKGLPANPANPTGPLAALKDHRFEEQVEIKLDMLVILLVNLDLPAGLVNGSQGKVVGFEPYDPNKLLVPRPPGSPSKNGKNSERNEIISELATIREDQIREFIERTPSKEWPVVQFNNGVKRTIYAACQLNELGSEKPHSLLGRTQIPLLAAWAITIHKSQGMTLDKVSVDLHNSFEKEMVYVALSRARSLAGLEVLRLPRSMKVGMNPQVRDFLSVNNML